MRSFYTTFCGHMKHLLRMRVCSTFTRVSSVHGMSPCFPQTWVSTPLQCLGWNCQRHCHGPLFASWQAAYSMTLWFSGNCSTKTVWRWASSCEAKSWFQQDGAPEHYGEDVQLNATYQRRWTGRQGPTARPPWSQDLTLADFFLWGHSNEHIYAAPSRTSKDLVARLQAPVTTINVNMFVQENSMTCTATYLKMDGGHFEHLLQLHGAHGLISWQFAPFDGDVH